MRKLKKKKMILILKKFVCVKTDGAIFNFNKSKNSLASSIYGDKNLLKNAETNNKT